MTISRPRRLHYRQALFAIAEVIDRILRDLPAYHFAAGTGQVDTCAGTLRNERRSEISEVDQGRCSLRRVRNILRYLTYPCLRKGGSRRLRVTRGPACSVLIGRSGLPLGSILLSRVVLEVAVLAPETISLHAPHFPLALSSRALLSRVMEELARLVT